MMKNSFLSALVKEKQAAGDHRVDIFIFVVDSTPSIFRWSAKHGSSWAVRNRNQFLSDYLTFLYVIFSHKQTLF